MSERDDPLKTAAMPDGMHCVYGKCQGIPNSPHPCHPGCYFQASATIGPSGVYRCTRCGGLHLQGSDCSLLGTPVGAGDGGTFIPRPLYHHELDAILAARKPHGCICPPGAEATCQGFGCPRRAHDYRQLSGAHL